jgi:hypothetical protein
VDDSSTQNTNLVGLESKLATVRSHLKEMKILGFIGMGGIGKTTLAKFVFDHVKSTYNASCFIEQMKSKSSHEIQWEILEKLKHLDKEDKPNKVDAQQKVRELLATKKIILILDDPLNQVQVRDIILVDDQFVNKGTNIIITSRDWGLMKDFVEEKGKIDVRVLDGNAAKELFNSYASSDEGQLPPQFFDIRDKIVEACNGLPLSLQIMGAFLQDKERIRSWERAFQRMKRGRCLDGDEGLWRTLRVSFDALKDEEKKLYLDIACFFPMGDRKELVLLKCASPSHVLDVLVDKSLVKIDVDGHLEMHDHLRDMGRMIVEREEVYKGTRIWKKDMIHSANGQTNKVFYM